MSCEARAKMTLQAFDEGEIGVKSQRSYQNARTLVMEPYEYHLVREEIICLGEKPTNSKEERNRVGNEVSVK